jgi:hypothetical protein
MLDDKEKIEWPDDPEPMYISEKFYDFKVIEKSDDS